MIPGPADQFAGSTPTSVCQAAAPTPMPENPAPEVGQNGAPPEECAAKGPRRRTLAVVASYLVKRNVMRRARGFT
jgi:hypothetical protein